MSVSSETVPFGLELVIDFVNTRDLESETDVLASPDDLREWLSDHGFGEDSLLVGETELAAAIELREALRAVIFAHNGGPPASDANATLERASRQGELSVGFRADGNVEMTARDPGFSGTLARLLVPVAAASLDGAWERVKACRADECMWAFYDSSRNRSGRWCDMAVCGNRTKVRTYRRKSRKGQQVQAEGPWRA